MTKLLNWQADWTLGIEPLDRDHRRMVDLLAQIACQFGPRAPDPDAIAEGDCPPDHVQGEVEPGGLFRALERFADHARAHFRREEEFMRTIDYPGLPAHHKEHALLLAEFAELVRHLRDQGLSRLDKEMLGSFRHWVVATSWAQIGASPGITPGCASNNRQRVGWVERSETQRNYAMAR